MMIGIGICLGVVIGAILGAIAMYLFIKDAEIEKIMERQLEEEIGLENPWDTKSLDEIMREEESNNGEY